MTTTMYDISAYSRGGSFMNLNIIRPIPSTTKLDMNVKVLRKLLSLSYFYQYINYPTLTRTC